MSHDNDNTENVSNSVNTRVQSVTTCPG